MFGFNINLGLGSVGGGESWNPSEVVGTSLWLDAKKSVFTMNGATQVAEWYSVGSTTLKAIQTTALLQPIITAGQFVSTEFSSSAGTKKFMNLPTPIIWKTAIIVCKHKYENPTVSYITANNAYSLKGNLSLYGAPTYDVLAVVSDAGNGVTLNGVTGQIPAQCLEFNKKGIATVVLNASQSVLRKNKAGLTLGTMKIATTATIDSIMIRPVVPSLSFVGDVYSMYFNSNILDAETYGKIEDYLISLHGAMDV